MAGRASAELLTEQGRCCRVFVSYYIPKGNPQSSLTYYPRDKVSKEPKHLSK